MYNKATALKTIYKQKIMFTETIIQLFYTRYINLKHATKLAVLETIFSILLPQTVDNYFTLPQTKPNFLNPASNFGVHLVAFKKIKKERKDKDYVNNQIALQIYDKTFAELNKTEIMFKADNVEFELKRLSCEAVHKLDEKNVKSTALTF